jgi:hypothetical protein
MSHTSSKSKKVGGNGVSMDLLCVFFFVLMRVTTIKLTYGALFLKSGSHISVAGRSITGLGRRLKVDTSLISSVY